MKWYEILLSIVTSDIFCTIIGGVLVFAISQWLLELVIKPRVEYKKTINKILYSLSYYADVIANPMKIHRDKYVEEFKVFADSKHARASEELRKLGSEVVTFSFKKKRNEYISEQLIYLSNAMWYYEDLPFNKEDKPSVCLRDLRYYISNKRQSKKEGS